MEITPRSVLLNRALIQLQRSINIAYKPQYADLFDMLRDSIIQRFEFSSELFWKCLKDELQKRHGIEIAAPKAVIRQSYDQGLISEEESDVLIEMIGDRNDTTHLYEEPRADEIARKTQRYKDLMKGIADRIFGQQKNERSESEATSLKRSKRNLDDKRHQSETMPKATKRVPSKKQTKKLAKTKTGSAKKSVRKKTATKKI